jgi:DNA-directed RNA polymerase subunit beta
MTDNGVHHQRHRARDCQPLHWAPGRVFERSGARLFPRQDYSLSRKLGRIRVRQQEHPYVRIDRKRKFYGSVFLRALGLKTDEQILRAFYRVSKMEIHDKKLFWNVDENLTGLKLSHAITTKGGDTVVGQGKKITGSLYKEILKSKITVEALLTISKARLWSPTWWT